MASRVDVHSFDRYFWRDNTPKCVCKVWIENRCSVCYVSIPVLFGNLFVETQRGFANDEDRLIKWLMYLLSPVAYPTACLLDRLLGSNHGIMFNRKGLKSFIMLHENLSGLFPQRLNQEEVLVISSIIDLKERQVCSIMTPITSVYSLNTESTLNDRTCYNILKSGHSCIPIHMANDCSRFTGVLSVKSLVAMRFEGETTVSEISLSNLPTVRPDVSCQDVIHLFRKRRSEMVLVTEGGVIYGQPLGILTYKDIMEEVIGE